MEGMGNRIALLAVGLTAISPGAPGVGAILTIFLAGLAISGAAIVWFSLLIRKALLLVAIVFGPIALAGATWDAAKGWFSKWVAFVVALILSKLVLVVIFLVAVAQVSAPIDADLASVSDPIAGIVLMFIAAFAPYITYKFLNFVGLDMYHAMSSEQEAKSALNRPVPVPSAPMMSTAQKVLGPGGSGGATSAGPAPTAPSSSSGPGPTSSAAGVSSAGASANAGAGSSAGVGSAAAGVGTGVATAGVAAGAAVVSTAGKAGPKIGSAVAQKADAHTQSAGNASAPSAPASKQTRPPAAASPQELPARRKTKDA